MPFWILPAHDGLLKLGVIVIVAPEFLPVTALIERAANAKKTHLLLIEPTPLYS
ncbi:MAG: hypothetical protein H0A75_05845 [Candidatus Methanofishera endochildressiae]|uniref:Uncharacterized protein n=1 Tax=Candidatus Methanofishera endochildressiae TaxID=2738884 RepID=A0A7Z0MPI7_9GAMM|nr:hypothetical protein [Candidatus Methanofishera endochildressiae]